MPTPIQDELLIPAERFEMRRFHDEYPPPSGRFLDGRRSRQQQGILTVQSAKSKSIAHFVGKRHGDAL